MRTYAKADEQNDEHEEEGADVGHGFEQRFRDSREPFRDGYVLENFEPHLERE